MSTNKKTRNKPDTYQPKLHKKIAVLAATLGMTNAEIAKEMGIAESTFHLWQNKYPDLKEEIHKAKEEPDKKVEKMLFNRTQGMEYEEKEIIQSPDGSKRAKIVKKWLPPSDVAIIFWLKNRQRDRWKDRWEIDGLSDKLKNGFKIEIINKDERSTEDTA